MNLANLIEGLAILSKYFNDPSGYYVQADHDVIYITATNIPVQLRDVELLYELGFFQKGEDTLDSYDPDKDWQAYT